WKSGASAACPERSRMGREESPNQRGLQPWWSHLCPQRGGVPHPWFFARVGGHTACAICLSCRTAWSAPNGSASVSSYLHKHSRVPPFAKNAKDGAPPVLLMPSRSKAWATRPAPHTLGEGRLFFRR